jgi:hypothetical protein
VGHFRKDLPGRNNHVFFKRCQKKKDLGKPPPPSAKECWEFFFSSGPVIKKNSKFFGGKAFLKWSSKNLEPWTLN